MSLRHLFQECSRCRGRCLRVYSAGGERNGHPVLVRKFRCERCGHERTLVEREPPQDGWPRPDRTWDELNLPGDAFA